MWTRVRTRSVIPLSWKYLYLSIPVCRYRYSRIEKIKTVDSGAKVWASAPVYTRNAKLVPALSTGVMCPIVVLTVAWHGGTQGSPAGSVLYTVSAVGLCSYWAC